MQPWLQGGANNTPKRETSYCNPTGWRDMLSLESGALIRGLPGQYLMTPAEDAQCLRAHQRQKSGSPAVADGMLEMSAENTVLGV